MLSRRDLLKTVLLAPALPPVGLATPLPQLKPPRLKPGDTVGLFCPAAPAYSHEQAQITIESLQALGLKTRLSAHFYDRYGYLAGHDEDRAADLNALFADQSVQAVMAMHGGWGCARILPLLNYEQMRRTPKIVIGYSDITALLLAINAKTGMVTMHGPEGSATWNSFTVNWVKRMLIDAEATTLQNPTTKGDTLTQTNDRIVTLYPGTARGRLVGGNLTVLSHLVGTPYLPDFRGALLFLEDVYEDVYRMDRMFAQLKLAGILGQLSGFVFGKCTRCEPNSGGGYGSLTLEEILTTYIEPLGIPAYSGAMIGHIADKFTVPVGLNAEMDANRGTIQLLESAVV